MMQRAINPSIIQVVSGTAGNPENIVPESDGQQADDGEPDGSRHEYQSKQSLAGISECAGARNDNGKRKWRRGEQATPIAMPA